MDLENYQVKLNESYPEIENAVPDSATVSVLRNLAFSKTGELGAVLEYIYQSNIADKTDNDLGKLFEEIAITEMIHLNLLMHAICAFGGVPKYELDNGAYFNTASINYTQKLKEMLEHNITGEKMAVETYNNAISRVKNESLKALFARIIKDEELHINIFTHLLNSVKFLSI